MSYLWCVPVSGGAQTERMESTGMGGRSGFAGNAPGPSRSDTPVTGGNLNMFATRCAGTSL